MATSRKAFVPGRRRQKCVLPELLRFSLIVLCLITCASLTAAQGSPGRWELFAEGGGSFSNDHFIDSSGPSGTILNTIHIPTSGRLFIGFRFWFNEHEALEGSYSYTPADIVSTSACEHVNCGEAITVSKARASFFSANYVHSFRVHSRVRPFLTAGIGRIDINCLGPNPCFEADPFTVNIGGGVDFRIRRDWFVQVEDRDWLFEGIRQNDFFQSGATGLTHNQVPSLGLVYRF